jgi:hypothetical protein
MVQMAVSGLVKQRVISPLIVQMVISGLVVPRLSQRCYKFSYFYRRAALYARHPGRLNYFAHSPAQIAGPPSSLQDILATLSGAALGIKLV